MVQQGPRLDVQFKYSSSIKIHAWNNSVQSSNVIIYIHVLALAFNLEMSDANYFEVQHILEKL